MATRIDEYKEKHCGCQRDCDALAALECIIAKLKALK